MATSHFRIFIILLMLLHATQEFRFMRRIQGIGYPYYKMLMALGSCKERMLFYDQKIWGKIKLHRILDIYYKSDDDNYKVSRVEILLVINNTSSFAYSDDGVGHNEFSGCLYLPANVGIVIYSLRIYTCSHNNEEIVNENYNKAPISYLPFYHSDLPNSKGIYENESK